MKTTRKAPKFGGIHATAIGSVASCGRPAVSVCGLDVGLNRAYVTTSKGWDATKVAHRCPACHAAIEARRAELLREVAEIEARDAAKAAAKAA